MTEIQIAVINKIPSVIGDIKCMISDNTDYTARFSFDDQWDEGTKNVFFVLDDGYAFPVVRMEGDVVEIPRVQKGGISRVLYIGVTQGDIRTTSGIGIRVKESITDMISDEAVQPDPSMWDDILARLIAVEENVDEVVAETVEDYLRENPIGVPTKLSELENDTGFITRLVNDLANYYRKSETYTREEVDG